MDLGLSESKISPNKFSIFRKIANNHPRDTQNKYCSGDSESTNWSISISIIVHWCNFASAVLALLSSQSTSEFDYMFTPAIWTILSVRFFFKNINPNKPSFSHISNLLRYIHRTTSVVMGQRTVTELHFIWFAKLEENHDTVVLPAVYFAIKIRVSWAWF